MFVRFERGTIIGKLDGKGYKIPAKSFVRLVQKGADPELAKATKEAAAKQAEAKEILKTLGLGDMVRCNDGEVYKFIKLNKTKFLGRLGNDVSRYRSECSSTW